ncbi:MAG: hypothetical protein QM635_04135 [Microbacteriaceae bacterium]
MKNVNDGFESRTWLDSHLDSADTYTTWSGCSTIYNAGWSWAKVSLWDEFGLLPDQSMGTKKNTCGKSNWGEMTRSDNYHWHINSWNGSDTGYKFSVSSVYTKY